MKRYFSLIKFSHTIFAMPFSLIGFFLATKYYEFDWITLFYVIMCMIFARSSAMGFNRYVDREFDLNNPRTSKTREIPTGTIKASSVLIFVIINSLLFITTTYFINHICFILSPIALLIILGYSYTKRFTALCHLFLGLGLALSPIGAYLAISGEFSLTPLLFSIVVFFWISGFDIIYALQDKDFDKKYKLHSIPVALGKKRAVILSRIFHIIAITTLAFIGITGEFYKLYWVGTIIFSFLLYYQHTLMQKSIEKIDISFFTINGIASIILSIFVILDVLS